MEKKIICISCNSLLGTFENEKIIFKNMKALSQIEINFKNIDVQCHSCHNWISIDKDGNITLNNKRKSDDAFFNFYKSSKK